MEFNTGIEDGSRVDTIDWSDISELRIYGSYINLPFILRYILLTEKDCERFRKHYPFIGQSAPKTFQLLEVIQGQKNFGEFSVHVHITPFPTSMAIYGGPPSVLFMTNKRSNNTSKLIRK